MKKKNRDLFAPIYEKTMRADRKVCAFIYERIPMVIRSKEVLEIAAGPAGKACGGSTGTHGRDRLFRRHIQEAKKGVTPVNLTFEPTSATALPCADDSFDAVLIAGTLHVMPESEKALRVIDLMLQAGGVLIT